MSIKALGYLGIRSDRESDWAVFASSLLGMQQADRGNGQLSFRMDDRKQRLVISNEPGESLSFMGWEVEKRADLDNYAARLDAAGHNVERGSRDLTDRRFVEELIWFEDPAGNRVELVHSPLISDDAFVPGRPHSGFKTGPLGMGHAVLHVVDTAPMVSFYRDLLDFQVTDYALSPIPLHFFHVNGRHHSFAMIGSGHSGLHHFMVEFGSLDDVGQGYDIAQNSPDMIAYTLGRHTNDWMTSFYANSPSGFFVESGWGGRVIDADTWVAHETDTGPSFWGHDRLNLSAELRAKYSDMRMDLAARGGRAPPLAECPWLYSQLTGQKA